jgi:hypothetical protein
LPNVQHVLSCHQAKEIIAVKGMVLGTKRLVDYLIKHARMLFEL